VAELPIRVLAEAVEITCVETVIVIEFPGSRQVAFTEIACPTTDGVAVNAVPPVQVAPWVVPVTTALLMDRLELTMSVITRSKAVAVFDPVLLVITIV
jgi:hypothetical protein